MAFTDEGTGGGAAESVGGAGDEDTGHGIILPPVVCWHRSAARGTWHQDPDYRSRAGEISKGRGVIVMAEAAVTGGGLDRRRWVLLWVIGLAQLMVVLDLTSLIPSGS
jgi:hypothetical protein